MIAESPDAVPRPLVAGLVRRARAGLAAAILLVVAGGAAGDEPPVPIRLLVNHAIESNSRLRALDARIASVREEARRSAARPNPRLSLRAQDIPRGNYNPWRGDKRLMLSQRFAFPGKHAPLRRVASEETQAMSWERVALRNDIAAEVVSASADLHLVYATLQVLDGAETRMRDLANLARARSAPAGTGQEEYLAATNELSRLDARARAVRARLRAATARLNLRLERGPGDALGTPEWNPSPMPSLDIDAMEALALQVSPVVRASDHEVASRERAIELAGREGRPDLTTALGWMALRNTPDTWLAELRFDLPLRNRGGDSPARRGAEASLAGARAERDSVRNGVLVAIEDAWARFVAADIEVGRYRDVALPGARLLVESRRAAYERRSGGLDAVIRAARDEVDARVANEEALVEREKALADLARAVGDMSLVLGTGLDTPAPSGR